MDHANLFVNTHSAVIIIVLLGVILVALGDRKSVGRERVC